MDAVKLIATDMDHTLLTEKGELPPNFDHYICELDRLGIYFAIASGRPLYTLKTIFPEVQRQMILIGDNGGTISYRNKLIFKSLLAPSDYRSMIQFVEEKTDGIAIVCGLDSAFLASKYKRYQDYLQTFYAQLTFVDQLDQLTCEADKLTAFFPQRDSKKYYEEVFKPEYGQHFSVTVGDVIWIDIMNRGINKGKAMKLLGRHLGIKAEQMMAFGDTYNDIEMLQAVYYSYIVANADEDMQQYANFRTDSNDHYGVVHIIDQVIHNHLRRQS